MKDSENKTSNFSEQYAEKIIKEREAYINWDKEYRQLYWSKYIFSMYFRHEEWDFPISIKDFRENHKDLEENFDQYLLWSIEWLLDFWYTISIEDIFILDEQAKKAIEVQSNVNNSLWEVNEVLDWWKTEDIEWINISYEELAERIGNLYYDSLAVFIADLKDNIDNKEIKSLLNEAFSNISTAWGYCKKPAEDYLESIKEKPEKVRTYKHTNQVKWIDIENKELAKRIWNLVNSELSRFLEKFSEKMYRDWDADAWREPPRIKLATELYACADKLKKASELLNKKNS